MTHGLSKSEIDVLKEICNIGAGGAATSLGKMLQTDVKLRVPSVNILSFSEIESIVGGAERPVAVAYVRVGGEANGDLFFLLPAEEMGRFINLLKTGFSLEEELRKPHYASSAQAVITAFSFEEADPLTRSLFEETANIVIGAYISALSSFCGVRLTIQPPVSHIDMALAAVSDAVARLAQYGDYFVAADTQFTIGFTDFSGHFLFFFPPDFYQFLFRSLGVRND